MFPARSLNSWRPRVNWCNLTSAVIQAISVETAQLDLLFTTYADLFARVQQQPPNVVEIAALATVLHSFYNGVESIFLVVARQLDQSVPVDPRWHRVLLNQMSQPTPTRPAVISAAVETRLTDYLAFRHYFRHAYTFMLDWARMEPLVQGLSSMYQSLRHELDTFQQLLAIQSNEN